MTSPPHLVVDNQHTGCYLRQFSEYILVSGIVRNKNQWCKACTSFYGTTPSHYATNG